MRVARTLGRSETSWYHAQTFGAASLVYGKGIKDANTLLMKMREQWQSARGAPPDQIRMIVCEALDEGVHGRVCGGEGGAREEGGGLGACPVELVEEGRELRPVWVDGGEGGRGVSDRPIRYAMRWGGL